MPAHAWIHEAAVKAAGTLVVVGSLIIFLIWFVAILFAIGQGDRLATILLVIGTGSAAVVVTFMFGVGLLSLQRWARVVALIIAPITFFGCVIAELLSYLNEDCLYQPPMGIAIAASAFLTWAVSGRSAAFVFSDSYAELQKEERVAFGINIYLTTLGMAVSLAVTLCAIGMAIESIAGQ